LLGKRSRGMMRLLGCPLEGVMTAEYLPPAPDVPVAA